MPGLFDTHSEEEATTDACQGEEGTGVGAAKVMNSLTSFGQWRLCDNGKLKWCLKL
jgi:hypothetical protein